MTFTLEIASDGDYAIQALLILSWQGKNDDPVHKTIEINVLTALNDILSFDYVLPSVLPMQTQREIFVCTLHPLVY